MFDKVKKTLGKAVGALPFVSDGEGGSSTLNGTEEYNPYGYGDESSVSSGVSGIGSITSSSAPSATDYGPGGIFHTVFFGYAGTEPLSLYYTNNDFGPGSQGWLPLVKINSATEIYNDTSYLNRLPQNVAGDENGGAHFVWEEKPTLATFFNLAEFQQTATDLWYRTRARDGELSAEIRITNYDAEVTQAAADAERCGYESPAHGRAWWVRPRAKRPTIEATQEGVPVFSWEKNWYVRAFDPLTGQPCSNGVNPPVLPIEYLTSLVVQQGIAGTEQRISSITGYDYFIPRFLLVDHENNQHLFFEQHLYSNGTLFHSWRNASGNWNDPVQVGRPGWYYRFNDFALDEENVIHVVLDGLPPDNPAYVRVTGSTIEEIAVSSLSGTHPEGIAVNRDGQAFIVDDDSNVHSLVNEEWRIVGSIDNCTAGLCSWVHGLEVTENDTLLAPIFTSGSYSTAPALNIVSTPVVAREGEGAAVSIDANTTVNVATGDLKANVPLFSTAGVGPQAHVSLRYGSLSRTGFKSFAHDPVPGWRLQPGMAIRKYANTEENYPVVWLEKESGEIVELIKDYGDPGSSYEFRSQYGDEQFVRLIEHEDGSWELFEEDGTKSYFLKSGQIDFTQDASGNVLDYEYSDNSLTLNVTEENLIRITDAQGRTSTFEYSADNLLTRIQDPELHDYTFQYYELDETGGGTEQRLLKSVTRVRTDGQPSETWSFVYHSSNDTTHECSRGGGLCPTKRAYIQSVTNPSGFTTEYYFEIGGRFTKALNPSGDVFQASYDNLFNDHTTPLHCEAILPNPSDWYTPARDLKTTITDWRGNTATFESDFETATVWIASDALRGTPQGGTLERSFREWYSYGDEAAYHVFKECESDKRGATTLYEWIAGPPEDFVKLQLEDINLPSVSNPIHYTYTSAHEVSTVTDPLLNVMEYRYEDSRNPHLVTSILEPPDQTGDPQATTVMTYDGQGRLKTKLDPNGYTTTYNYDEYWQGIADQTGLVTSVVYPGIEGRPGGRERFAYNDLGQVRFHKPAGLDDSAKTEFRYDGANRLQQSIFPATVDHGLSTITNEYDLNGNLKQVTDQQNRVTSYEYDELDRRWQVRRHDGTISTTEYDENGNVTALVDFRGSRKEFDYNELNRLVEERQPFEHLRVGYEYDANGNKRFIREYDRAGNQRFVEFEYDELNRLKKTLFEHPYGEPERSSVTNGYDDNSNLTARTDQRGNTTNYCYTNRNLLSFVIYPGGVADCASSDRSQRLSYTYDLNGNRRTETIWRNDTPDGTIGPWLAYTAAYTYNERNLLSVIRDPLEHETKHFYDDTGNLTDAQDAVNDVTHFAYDTLGREKTVTLDYGVSPRLNLTSEKFYDPIGNITKTVDAENKTTTYTYDALYRLEDTNTSLGRVSHNEYDPNGNLQLTIDGNANRTTYIYDQFDRLLIRRNNRGTDTLAVEYDDFGDLYQQTDGSGRVTTFGYDKLHRLILTTYPESRVGDTVILPAYTVGRDYDLVGNLNWAQDSLTAPFGPNTDVAFTYDNRNRPETVTDTITGRTLTYQHNNADQRLNLTVSPGALENVSYRYDEAGRLKGMTDGSGGYTFDYYNDNRRFSLTRPNGLKSSYLYDGAKRSVYLRNEKSDESLVSDFTSIYDNVGNQKLVSSTIGGQSFQVAFDYDALYRLKEEQRTGFSPNYWCRWDYDLVGNRTVQRGCLEQFQGHLAGGPTGEDQITFAYNDLNQLISQQIELHDSDDFETPPLTGWTALAGDWNEADGRLIGQADAAVGPALIERSAELPGPLTGASVKIRRSLSTVWNGLLFNFSDDQNYYAAEILESPAAVTPALDAEGTDQRRSQWPIQVHQVRLLRVAGGEATEIAVEDFSPGGQQTTLSLAPSGTGVSVSVNGVEKIIQPDIVPTTDSVGLISEGRGLFDNFTLDAIGDPTGCTYDSNSNLSGCTDGTTYSYDSQDRLAEYTSLEPADETGQRDETVLTTIQYRYDAFDRRVKRYFERGAVVQTERSLFDQSELLADFDDTGAPVALYSNGASPYEKLGIRREGQPYFFLPDSRGRTVEVLDQAQTTENRYNGFTAFGLPLPWNPASETVDNRFLVPGAEWNRESSLSHQWDEASGGYRMFDPRRAIFVNQDPRFIDIVLGQRPGATVEKVGPDGSPKGFFGLAFDKTLGRLGRTLTAGAQGVGDITDRVVKAGGEMLDATVHLQLNRIRGETAELIGNTLGAVVASTRQLARTAAPEVTGTLNAIAQAVMGDDPSQVRAAIASYWLPYSQNRLVHQPGQSTDWEGSISEGYTMSNSAKAPVVFMSNQTHGTVLDSLQSTFEKIGGMRDATTDNLIQVLETLNTSLPEGGWIISNGFSQGSIITWIALSSDEVLSFRNRIDFLSEGNAIWTTPPGVRHHSYVSVFDLLVATPLGSVWRGLLGSPDTTLTPGIGMSGFVNPTGSHNLGMYSQSFRWPDPFSPK